MDAAIYPGTFDPPTLGHLNVIKRSADHVGRLVVAVGKNPQKLAPSLSCEERMHFLKILTKDMHNVEVSSFDGLLVDFAKTKNIRILIKAVRTAEEFENESMQAYMNRKLGNLETFYLSVDENFRLISSTLVREIASQGARLHGLIPEEIEEAVFQKLNRSA